MKAWEFYSNPGGAVQNNLLKTCNGHTIDEMNGVPFSQCLADITKNLASPDPKHLLFMEGIANAFDLDLHQKDCLCNSDYYSIGHLMRVCPFTSHQHRNMRTVAALNPEASGVCMLPVDSVQPIFVETNEEQTGQTEAIGEKRRCVCPHACEYDERAYMCCGEECVDSRNSTLHCGKCWNSCDAELERCHDGECVLVMWDTCNCGAPGHVCKETQMCYGMDCLNPLTKADAQYAQENLKCDGRTQHKVTDVATQSEENETWFTTVTLVDKNAKEQRFFSVISKDNQPEEVHARRKRDVEPTASKPDGEGAALAVGGAIEQSQERTVENFNFGNIVFNWT